MYRKLEIEFAGRPLSLETGRLAKQAHGSVLAQYGETMVLATVVSAYESRDKIDFLFTRIGEDTSGRLGLDLGVTGAPETFVVDKKGRIRLRYPAPIDEAAWAGTFQPLLAKLNAEPG